MKVSRPFTANKDIYNSKNQSKTLLSQIKRPTTAKNDSLKRIIQVIESTLNKGAQAVLAKTKTLDKFSKIKNQSLDYYHFKQVREKTRYQRDVPHFKTEFFINNSVELQKSTKSIKSSKKIFQSFENDEFVPYSKQNNYKQDVEEIIKKERAPIKKVVRQKRVTKQNQKVEKIEKTTDSFNIIDKWQNEPSILNISFLLDRKML